MKIEIDFGQNPDDNEIVAILHELSQQFATKGRNRVLEIDVPDVREARWRFNGEEQARFSPKSKYKSKISIDLI